MNTKQFDIICFGDQWDAWWNRRQMVMSKLSAYDQSRFILYVERPLTLFSLIKFAVGKTDYITTKRWKRFFKKGILIREKNIFVLTLIWILPLLSWKKIQRINRFFEFHFHLLLLKYISKRLGLNNIILWFTFPINAIDFIGKFKESLVCYDANEDYSAFDGTSNLLKESIRYEDDVLTKSSDIILAGTRLLLNKKVSINPNTYYSPNAVDTYIFSLPGHERRATLEDMNGINPPIIGFVGRETPRINLELITYAAEKHPEWAFVLIGNFSSKANGNSDLHKLNNIYVLGPKPYHLLPYYLERFDICLNIYKDSYLNITGSCTKIFTYLASGKPIVSTNMAEAEDFKEVVNIVPEDKEVFMKAIEHVLAYHNPELAKKRLSLAQKNSWDKRVENIVRILMERLNIGQENYKYQTSEDR